MSVFFAIGLYIEEKIAELESHIMFDYLIPISKYIEIYKSGKTKWKPDLSDSQLMFVYNNKDYGGLWLNSGSVYHVSCQLENILIRLKNRKPAIFLQAIKGTPKNEFLLFEPSPNHVSITCLCVSTNELIEDCSDNKLLNEFSLHFIMNNKKRLATSNILYDLPFPLDIFINDLPVNIENGRNIYSLIDRKIEMPLY